MKQLLAGCVALALCGVAQKAWAESSPVPLAPQSREPSAHPVWRWYGWQILAVDTASLGVLIGGSALSSGDGVPPLALLGLAGYVAGAPALHFVHERPGAAAGSIGLRLLLPLLGGAVGSESAECPPPRGHAECGVSELAVGVGTGVLAAIAIDAAALSWRPVNAEALAAPQVGFAPVISSDRKRGELRVFGTF